MKFPVLLLNLLRQSWSISRVKLRRVCLSLCFMPPSLKYILFKLYVKTLFFKYF